jgi:PAP2 superfamily
MSQVEFVADAAANSGGGECSSLPLLHGWWLAGAVAIGAVVVLLLLGLCRLSINLSDWQFVLLAVIVLVTSATRFTTRGALTQNWIRLRDLAEGLLISLSITALGAIGSYQVAALTSGFADAQLQQIDQLLHFNWIEWYETVVAHPTLQWSGAAAYGSIYVSPLVLVAYFAWTGKLAHFRQLAAIYWLATVLTLLLFPLMPARGTLAYLWQGPIPYMPTNGLYQDAIIPALRARSMHVIDLASLRGLVCAPSFHTVCAVMFIVAAWRHRAMRWTVVPVNLAMLAAIPVEGTHYLIDMILGAVVAAISIAAVRAFVQWLAQPALRLQSIPYAFGSWRGNRLPAEG